MQNALPLRFEEGHLVVAVADPSNELVIENLRRSIGSEPRLVVAPHAQLIRAIGEAYGAGASLAAEQLEPAVEAAPPPVKPLSPVTPLQPPIGPVETDTAPEALPEPPLVPPAAEQDGDAPAASQEPDGRPHSLHVVRIRLRDGEVFEVGTFETAGEASTCAQDVVRQISAPGGDAAARAGSPAGADSAATVEP